MQPFSATITLSLGLPINCWHHIHFPAERKGFLPSSGITCGLDLTVPAVVGSLDRDYPYSSVVTQIPRDAGLTENSFTTGDGIGVTPRTTS